MKNHRSKEENDIVFEGEPQLDTLPENKKDKEKLQNSLAKQREYLDGWQRARAELVNYRRETEEKFARMRNHGRVDILQGLLPILDAFDLAMRGDAWYGMSDVYRQGIQQIHNQLLQTLADNDVEEIDGVGEPFNPELHEVLAEEEMTLPETDGQKIKEILQKGYKMGDMILRPARVILEPSE